MKIGTDVAASEFYKSDEKASGPNPRTPEPRLSRRASKCADLRLGLQERGRRCRRDEEVRAAADRVLQVLAFQVPFRLHRGCRKRRLRGSLLPVAFLPLLLRTPSIKTTGMPTRPSWQMSARIRRSSETTCPGLKKVSTQLDPRDVSAKVGYEPDACEEGPGGGRLQCAPAEGEPATRRGT